MQHIFLFASIFIQYQWNMWQYAQLKSHLFDQNFLIVAYYLISSAHFLSSASHKQHIIINEITWFDSVKLNLFILNNVNISLHLCLQCLLAPALQQCQALPPISCKDPNLFSIFNAMIFCSCMSTSCIGLGIEQGCIFLEYLAMRSKLCFGLSATYQ